VACVIALVAVTTASASTRGEKLAHAPRTLVTVHGKIAAFAQDGDRIAWASKCAGSVHVRSLSTGRGTVYGNFGMGGCPRWTHVGLALGGARPLWTLERMTFESGGGDEAGECITDIDVFAGWPVARVGRWVKLAHGVRDETDSRGGGYCLPDDPSQIEAASPTPVTGEGKTLAYAAGRRIVLLRGTRKRLLTEDATAQVRSLAAVGGRIAALKESWGEEDSSSCWSPGGKLMVFQRRRHDLSEWPEYAAYPFGWETSAVYVADARGERPLTPLRVNHFEGGPVWSPDGKKIAIGVTDSPDYFSSEYELDVINADGTGRVKLTRRLGAPLREAYDFAPVWSPDGSKLVYWDDGLAVSNADGTNSKHLTEPSEYVRAPHWSADSSKVEFAGPGGIWETSAGGNDQHRHKLADLSLADGPIAWAADGTKLAVATLAGIDVLNVDGSSEKLVTDDTDTAATVRWSSSGSRLAYTDGGALYVMAGDGSGRRLLANGVAGAPAWKPDESEIAVARTDAAAVAVNVETGSVRRLTHPAAWLLAVDVRNANSRNLVGRARLASDYPTIEHEEARGVALSRSFLVVFVQTNSSQAWLEVRNPTSGKLRRRIKVGRDVEELGALSISGRSIVYSVSGRLQGNLTDVRLADAVTGRTRVLAEAEADPIGLSIEGKRIAWAENVRGNGRVREVVLG